MRCSTVLLGIALLGRAAAAELVQQGGKLIGADAVGAAGQGVSVAVSADGSTAIVGGYTDQSGAGAVWVFTRSGGVWSQQGGKLVGSGAVGGAWQGHSVAISADGNTALVGGPNDDGFEGFATGAAWVFTRSGGIWSQQGGKLVGTGADGLAKQGLAVALSADGDTAIVGGVNDGGNVGAAWVFTRSGGIWSQQGAKLVGAGAVGGSFQGTSVALSADGSTALVGGPSDQHAAGAAWVFTRSGGVWSQQGAKLVGANAYGVAQQGTSVALSADGSTAIVGGPADGAGVGAAWVYGRSGGAWVQQGGKVSGTDYSGGTWGSRQGTSVALSADGSTAIVGGPADSAFGGAVWVFGRNGGAWSQQGSKLIGSDAAGAAAQGVSVAVAADGRTVIVGGYGDDANAGAAWVFAVPAYDVWVPVASHNAGKNGSQWRSDLGLLNAGAAPASVRIDFLGGDRIASGTTSLPAGAQSILTDVVGQLGGSGSGALRIASDLPLRITARSYNQVTASAACYANGTQGQDYPAVSPGDGLGKGQSAYLAGLVENPSYRSNIGVVDLGTDPAQVLIELFDGAGTKLGDYVADLDVGRWRQVTQPFLTVAGQTAMDRGYARVTVQAGSGVFAFASVIDNVTNDPTTVAMQR